MKSNKLIVFLKDSLIVLILGIIYIFLCSNSIALIKIFPTIHHGTCDNRQPDFLDYLYPTDLTKPPYQKSDNPSCQTKTPEFSYQPDVGCDRVGSYYSKQFEHIYKDLKTSMNKVDWPYQWFQESPGKGFTYWHKYKIANIVLNQCYFTRTIMKFFLKNDNLRRIPYFLFFIAIPFAGTTSSLTPIFPALTIIIAMITLPLIIIMTIITWLFIWIPPGEDGKPAFECPKENNECGPPFEEKLLMNFLQILGILLSCLFGDKFYKNLGKNSGAILWGILFGLALILFIATGGFILGFGIFSAAAVFIGTVLSTMSPLFLKPELIFSIFYCNKDVIALILTAIITARLQEQQTFNNSVINTMWGVWGLLLVMKIIVLIHTSIPV